MRFSVTVESERSLDDDGTLHLAMPDVKAVIIVHPNRRVVMLMVTSLVQAVDQDGQRAELPGFMSEETKILLSAEQALSIFGLLAQAIDEHALAMEDVSTS